MRTVVGVLIGLLFVGFMIYSALQEGRIQCEVCVDYGGGSMCRTSVAVDRDKAIQEATNSACAVLSSGVTDGIRCNKTPPRAITCSE